MNWKFMMMLSLLVFINLSCAQSDNIDMHHPVKDNPTETENSFTNAPFILGVGDELDITVWKNDDLKSSVRIDPDGNINAPLINEIKAEGLTIPQLKEVLTTEFSYYIKNPLVGINISNLRSQKIHVLGEVNDPGTVMLESRMLIWEAISQSGGFSNFANRDKVVLIRRNGDEIKLTAFNMNIGEQDKRLQSLYLRGKDVLYVPPTTMTKVARFMSQFNDIISPLLNLESGLVLWPKLIDALEGNGTDDNSQTIIVNP